MVWISGFYVHMKKGSMHQKKSGANIINGDTTVLSKDFSEFLRLLNNNNIRYLVVGGYAVAFHGYPRYTRDIDVWVQRSPQNAKKMLKVLEQFGFGSLDIKKEDFMVTNRVIQLGYPPNRIDLITSLTGLDFVECYQARVTADIHGEKINFIDVDNLCKNKRASGRPQDLADLENLERK